jgi:hypothetical protein
MTRTAVLAASCAIIWISAAGAAAKGPDQATVSGPGIDQTIAVRPHASPTLGNHMSSLIESSGIMNQLWCRSCDDLSAKQPTADLGPVYVVRYRVPSLIGGPTRWVEQQAYPFAQPHPLTYVAPGQPFWHQRTAGGWYEASSRLRHLLVGLGAQMEPASDPTTVNIDTLTLWPQWTLIAWAALSLVIAVLIVVGVVVVIRAWSARRTHPA